MVRTAGGPLGRIWLAAHWLAARLLAARLRAGTGATVYVRGSFASRNAIAGVSDVDMVAVSPPRGTAGDLAMGLLSARRSVVQSRLGAAAGHVTIALYTPAELADACHSTAISYGLGRAPSDPRRAATHLAPRAEADELGLRLRPPLHTPSTSWRRIAGPRLDLPGENPDRLTVAWLEVQYWWRHAFRLAARPGRPDSRHLAVKLVAEPAACAMWARGVDPPRRLEEILALLARRGDGDAEAAEAALALRRDGPHGPPADLRPALASLERSTTLVAERHLAAAQAAGFDDVALAGAAAPCGLPLVDWRARCSPGPPDECIDLRDGTPGDPGALATAAKPGPRTQTVLRRGDLMAMPSASEQPLRGVSCPVTDPVSHALTRREERARFPALPGWSARDCADRALAEHRAWLTRRPLMGGFGPRALELLLTSARAALFHESVAEGSPVLAVTTGAVVDGLAERHPRCAEPAAAGLTALSACRDEGGDPPRETVDGLERALRSLACFSDLPGARA